MAAEMDKAKKVKNLLKSHPNLSIKETEDGKCKVVCQLTSHEMPCTLKAVQTFINGKKYKSKCEHNLTEKETELCSDYLVEKPRGQLFCKLTKKYINNLPHHITQHLNGRRFQKAIKIGNSTSANSNQDELKQQGKTDSNKDTEMWVPSDSGSESVDVEALGTEFEVNKSTEGTEDNYSFDSLDMEVQEIFEENNEETNKTKKEKSETKLKRKNLEKSKQKGKKSHHDEMAKKKKKTS